MTERPTGTITFLFTDIEGSTGRWEEQTAEMREALARHDEVLRRAIERHDGWLFKHTGDGVLAAFASPTGALEAAIEAQRELELSVRMGVATGEAELRNDDYFGPTLNRAARIMAAGHGGQILLAQSTASLVDGIELLELGEHRLRDLSRPQQLFQVRAEGLRETFPSLKTLDATPGNLPLQATSFIGREADVAKVVEQLRGHRLVTLTGVGGVGKTRLALQVAAELASDFPGGAWVIELASVGDPAATAHSIAATLGVTPQPNKTIERSVVDALGGRDDLLLLLDNCEHLIDTVADFADQVIHHCAGVTMLATSREALRVDGEQAWPVPSLDVRAGVLSPAVGLFSERAQAVLPTFDPAADVDSVVEICRRLDGIPLAIELAAALVRSMSPAQIRDRLDERFRLLTGGSRRALERHQTLRHAVQWSYDLLEESERTLLRRASVFTGGFSLEGAESICSGDDLDHLDVIDLLDSLVRKSLVTTEHPGGDVRYGMLETIRQFAEEQLAASGDIKAQRDRHARYFADAAARNWELWLSPEQRLANEWFERELPNLRIAFGWALQAEDVATAVRIVIDTGLIGWELQRLEPIGWALEAMDPARRRSLRDLPDLLAVASLCTVVGDLVDGERLAREAIETAGAADHGLRSALPWYTLGLGLFTQGRVSECIDALRDGSRDQNEVPLHYSLGLLATVLGLSGNPKAALPLAEQALALASKAGIPSAVSFALEIRGDVHLYLDDFGRSVGDFQEAIRIADAAGLVTRATVTRRDLAVALMRSDDLRGALPLFLQQLRTARESGDWLVTRYTLQHLVVALATTGRGAAAATVSSAIDEAAVFPLDLGYYSPALAAVRSALGESEFERLRQRGAAMSFLDVVRYAEAEIRDAIEELGAIGAQ